MAYNYLGITWAQINGVLRPIHNEQGNFCLVCQRHLLTVPELHLTQPRKPRRREEDLRQ